MSSQNAKNLELLAQEVLSGEFQRSSPRVIQIAFDAAVRHDLSSVIDAIATEHQVEGGADTTLKVVHYTSISVVLSMLKNHEGSYLRMYKHHRV